MVRPTGVDELAAGEPRAVAAENARRKALGDPRGDAGARRGHAGRGRRRHPRQAARRRQAAAYVGRLAGRTHEVVGGIALARDGAVIAEHVEITRVRFRSLEPAEVAAYVALGEWEGRAGGYAIQGRGAALVRGIEGDYLNVVGLPLARLLDLLPHAGLQEILAR